MCWKVCACWEVCTERSHACHQEELINGLEFLHDTPDQGPGWTADYSHARFGFGLIQLGGIGAQVQLQGMYVCMYIGAQVQLQGMYVCMYIGAQVQLQGESHREGPCNISPCEQQALHGNRCR